MPWPPLGFQDNLSSTEQVMISTAPPIWATGPCLTRTIDTALPPHCCLEFLLHLFTDTNNQQDDANSNEVHDFIFHVNLLSNCFYGPSSIHICQTHKSACPAGVRPGGPAIMVPIPDIRHIHVATMWHVCLKPCRNVIVLTP